MFYVYSCVGSDIQCWSQKACDCIKSISFLNFSYLYVDKNPNNPEAQRKFEEIARAYEVSCISFLILQFVWINTHLLKLLRRCQVVSDTEKRQIYDLEGLEGLEAHEKGGQRGASVNPFDMFFGGGGGRRRGPDAHVEIEVTLEELYNGGTREARITRNVICPKCRGTGAKDGQTVTCKACKGRGVRMVQQQMAPGFVVQMQEQCPECEGKGKISKSKCEACGGRRVVPEEKSLHATIERGMASNAQIRFEKESEQQPGITPGDVVFILRQVDHPVFKRVGDDLHMDMHLTLKESLLGFEKNFTHLDGRTITLKHDGVTQPFETRRVRIFRPHSLLRFSNAYDFSNTYILPFRWTIYAQTLNSNFVLFPVGSR